MPTGQIKTVQLGDPGAGFELFFEQDIADGIEIKIELMVANSRVSHQHKSTLTIQGPVKKQNAVKIVMPYGCDQYPPGVQLSVQIDVTVLGTKTRIFNSNVVASDGEFNYRVRRSFLPRLPVAWTPDLDISQYRAYTLLMGESLRSENDRYRCRLNFNGCLEIYDLEHPKEPKWTINPLNADTYSRDMYAALAPFCNLTIFNGTSSYWQRGNVVRDRAFYLKLTDDGRLVLFRGNHPIVGEAEVELFDYCKK